MRPLRRRLEFSLRDETTSAQQHEVDIDWIRRRSVCAEIAAATIPHAMIVFTFRCAI